MVVEQARRIIHYRNELESGGKGNRRWKNEKKRFYSLKPKSRFPRAKKKEELVELRWIYCS